MKTAHKKRGGRKKKDKLKSTQTHTHTHTHTYTNRLIKNKKINSYKTKISKANKQRRESAK